ncbi:MAG: OmpA family protein [Zoogloeaceae bacterium]|jgi:outer membrane protein OmpA-like peptidoglycan-associated protein|nr:OmpA family protein [Zoogloeaceae bacterium]
MTRRALACRGGLVLLLLLAACDSNPARPDDEHAAALVVFAPPEAKTTREEAPVMKVVPVPDPAPALVPQAVAPEAIYTLEAEVAVLPPEAEASLQAIARRMKARRDLLIRLDSYAPASGSREMSLSLSRQAAARVKRRLVELGVPSYRIQQAPLGAEHPGESRLNERRVELFLLPLPR